MNQIVPIDLQRQVLGHRDGDSLRQRKMLDHEAIAVGALSGLAELSDHGFHRNLFPLLLVAFFHSDGSGKCMPVAALKNGHCSAAVGRLSGSAYRIVRAVSIGCLEVRSPGAGRATSFIRSKSTVEIWSWNRIAFLTDTASAQILLTERGFSWQVERIGGACELIPSKMGPNPHKNHYLGNAL